MRVDVFMIGFGQINYWLPLSPEQIRQDIVSWITIGQMTQEQADQINYWLTAHMIAYARGYRIKTHARSLKTLEECRKDWWQSTIRATGAPYIPLAESIALHVWADYQECYLKTGQVLQIAPTDPQTGLVLGTMIFVWCDD